MPFIYFQEPVPSTSCQDKLATAGSWNFPMWVRDSKCNQLQTTPSPYPIKSFQFADIFDHKCYFWALLLHQWCFLLRVLFCFGFISTEMVQRTSGLEVPVMWSNSPWHFCLHLPSWNQYQASIPMIRNLFLYRPRYNMPQQMWHVSALFSLYLKCS